MGVDTSYRTSTDHDAIVRTSTDPDGPGRHVRTRTDPDGPGRINPIIDTYDVRTRTDPDGPGRTRTDRTGDRKYLRPSIHICRDDTIHCSHTDRHLLQFFLGVFSLSHFDLYGYPQPYFVRLQVTREIGRCRSRNPCRFLKLEKPRSDSRNRARDFSSPTREIGNQEK